MSTEFSIKYEDKKLTVVVNGQELSNVRHIEMILPVYADPFIKVGQLMTPPGAIEQSIMTVITNIDVVDLSGSLKDGC